jgi:hypothetical protein
VNQRDHKAESIGRDNSAAVFIGHLVTNTVPKHPSLPSVSHGPHCSRAQMLERAALAVRLRQFADAEQLAEVLKASRTDTAAVSILARS